jgi:sugar lactone lactonase YvrE
MNSLAVVIDARAELGEGPCWDAATCTLYWVDLSAGKLHRYDTSSCTDQIYDIGQPLGAVAVRKGGGLVLALRHGFHLFDTSTGELTLIVDPEADLDDNRFNDGKCDPAGRFWAGTMSLTGKKHAGTLYRLDPDHSVHPMLSGLSISNGLGWSPDHTVMYVIDSEERHVLAFDYDIHTGNIANPRTIIVFREDDGLPDGMAVDSLGMLWIAHWGGFQVSRWNPNTGERLTSIPVPAKYVTSCTFGGPEERHLYITTARAGMTDADLQQYPLAGSVFRIETDVRGMPTYFYADS